MADKVIRDTVARRFSASTLDRVVVLQDTDSEGDLIYRIFIVLKDSEKSVDRTKMTGLVRHLRSALQNVDPDAFPLVSYLSKRDAEKLTFEAA